MPTFEQHEATEPSLTKLFGLYYGLFVQQKIVKVLLQEKIQKFSQARGQNNYIQKAPRLPTNAALDTEHLALL